MEKVFNWKNYNHSRDIDTIEIDFLEQLVRSVCDTTVNNVVLKPRKENIPSYWIDFIDAIRENNSLERLVKSDIRQKSLHGKSYVGFDMFNDGAKLWPILWVAKHNEQNAALRLNGMKPYAVRVIRNYSTSTQGGADILTNQVVYTQNDANYLFLGGFGVGAFNNRDIPSVARSNVMYKTSQGKAFFPFDWATLRTPDYILQQHKQGIWRHDYGVIPVQEFLNKDLADYDDDSQLSDWYPARDYIPLVTKYINYIAWEMNLDHTRIMGMFSMNDMNKIQSGYSGTINPYFISDNPNDKLNDIWRRWRYEQANQPTGSDALINQKLMVRAFGGQGAQLDKMNSTFDGEKHVKGIQSLISLIYKVCGYSWAVEDATGVYENVQQTQQTMRSVFETTKEKVELFTRQWKGLLSEMAYVYFRTNQINSLSQRQVREEFNNYIEFIIVSNIIINETNDWRRTMELHNAKLISTQKAIETINPEYSTEEIAQEVERIQQIQKAEMVNDFNAFENTKWDHEQNPNSGGD